MDEYIEREAAIRILRGRTVAKYPSSFTLVIFASADELKNIPSADVAPVRHGRWIKGGYACGETEWICSACEETEWRTGVYRIRYCPFCGAKMDLEE